MHESNHLDHRKELVLLDLKNPRSIASLMPEAFAKQMQALWNSEDAGALVGIPEHMLLKELVRRNKLPGPVDHMIRFKFWIEYERVQEDVPKMAKMNVINILGRLFPKETFYRFYITDPCKLAFILCPPTQYKDMIDVVLNVSMQKILEVLAQPPGESGAHQPPMIKKFMEINESMHRRKLQLEYRKGGGRSPASEDDDDDISASTPDIPHAPVQSEEQKLAELEALESQLKKLPGQA